MDAIGFSLNSTSLPQIDCTNFCSNDFDDICNERWKYLDQSQHITIQIILSSLFGLSILEWILESWFDFMPYRELHKIVNTSDSENQDSDEDSKSNKDSNEDSNKHLSVQTHAFQFQMNVK